MPAFFAQSRGTVVRVTPGGGMAGGVLPFRIVMAASADITDQDTRAIITQCAIVEQGNFQFMHTLGATIYAYIFGDRIGELRISGICFANPCGGGKSGMQQITDSYRKNRIAAAGRPVQISVGEVDYTAFNTGCTLEITDPERQLGQWALRFNTFPGNHK